MNYSKYVHVLEWKLQGPLVKKSIIDYSQHI